MWSRKLPVERMDDEGVIVDAGVDDDVLGVATTLSLSAWKGG